MEPCPWLYQFELYRQYHDEEWGVPLRDDRALFGIADPRRRSGRSLPVLIPKRAPRYRLVFDGFDPLRIAGYDEAQGCRPGWPIRASYANRAKVAAAIGNARAYLALAESGLAFGDWLLVLRRRRSAAKCVDIPLRGAGPHPNPTP